MRGPSLRLLASACVAAALLACGADDESVSLPPDSVPIAGCEQYSYVGCDVLEQACQANVMGLVSCLRGNDPADLPQVRVQTEAEYRAEREQQAAASPPDPRYEQAMVWLGLLAPGGLSTGTPAGVEIRPYYSSSTGVITLIAPSDPATPLDPEEATLTLSHETVHALQDRELDLSAQWELRADYDDSLAFRSVIEGETMIYETLVDAAFWGLDPGTIHLDQRFQEQQAETDAEVLASENPWLVSLQWFPYTYGASAAYGVYAVDGNAGLRARATDPPRMTLPIFAPGMTAPRSPWSTEPPAPSGFTALGSESLGAWATFVFLDRHGITSARATAQSWRADRLWLFGDATTTTVQALWRLRFGADVDVVALEAALSFASYAGATQLVVRAGSELLVLLGPMSTRLWASALTAWAAAP